MRSSLRSMMRPISCSHLATNSSKIWTIRRRYSSFFCCALSPLISRCSLNSASASSYFTLHSAAIRGYIIMLELERAMNLEGGAGGEAGRGGGVGKGRLRSVCVQSQARMSTQAATKDFQQDLPSCSLYLHQNRYKSLMKLIRETIQQPLGQPKFVRQPQLQPQPLLKQTINDTIACVGIAHLGRKLTRNQSQRQEKLCRVKTELPPENRREGGEGGKGHELRLFKLPKKTISQIFFKQRVAPQRQFLTIQQTQPMKSEEARLQLAKLRESEEMGRAFKANSSDVPAKRVRKGRKKSLRCHPPLPTFPKDHKLSGWTIHEFLE